MTAVKREVAVVMVAAQAVVMVEVVKAAARVGGMAEGERAVLWA